MAGVAQTRIHRRLHTHTHTHTRARTHTHTPHTQTQLIHTQLTHTYSSTHNFLHTNPSPSLFSFLLIPCCLCLSFVACWKKLTCGVIRSFNFLCVFVYRQPYKNVTDGWQQRSIGWHLTRASLVASASLEASKHRTRAEQSTLKIIDVS